MLMALAWWWGGNNSVHTRLFMRLYTIHLCIIASCPLDRKAEPERLHILHSELSYFRKLNIKWQMNANYTSIAQLKPEMLSTGSSGDPHHSSCAYKANYLFLVLETGKKPIALPGTPYMHRCTHNELTLPAPYIVQNWRREGAAWMDSKERLTDSGYWGATVGLYSSSLTLALVIKSHC